MPATPLTPNPQQPPPRPLTPLRMLAMVALVAAALWLGWKSWQVNITMSCWKKEWPHLAVCGDIMGRTPEEQAVKLQERLAQNPGDSQARVDLALLAQPPNAVAGLDAPALLAAAAQAAPQNGAVLGMLYNEALQQERWPEALDPLIRLSRYHGDAAAAQTLAALIAQASSRPPLMAALMAATQADSAWLDRPLYAMPKAKLNVALALPMILATMQANQLSPQLGQFVIREFKRNGHWGEAHMVWRHLWKRPLPVVFNGDFEQAFVPGGFDWELADSNDHRSGARLERVGRKERGQVLQLALTGKAIRPPMLRQDLLLPAGRYRLSGEVQSNDLRSAQGLAWVVSCASDGRELGRSSALKTTGREWAPWNANITVPADCPGGGARLTLQTFAPFEAKTGLRGEMLFNNITMERQGD